jgi:outer membrane protein TolC
LGKLSLKEAVQRGLVYNLSSVGLANAVKQAHGQAQVVRSALLPNVSGSLGETVQQSDLRAEGLRIISPIPGLSIPSIVGPFNYFDLRARLSQSVIDLTARRNYKSANEILRANELSAQDARDLVVQAVAGTYLQVVAAEARVESARSQLATANALYDQALQQRNVGVVAQVDVDRTEVEALTQQQRVLSLRNDLAKQKINLARMIGLPATDQYEISDEVPYRAIAPVQVEDALKQAYAERRDLKSAEAQVRAAGHTLSASRGERLPSLSLNADYGVIGTNPSQSHGTFSVSGALRFPIFDGGRIDGNIEQAQAALDQRRAELGDLKLQIEEDVRKAYLDLQLATSQIEVAQKNVHVSKETLELTRQRVEAGIANSVELVQSQESVASAELDYINSAFAHNLAKLSLARATGRAEEDMPNF